MTLESVRQLEEIGDIDIQNQEGLFIQNFNSLKSKWLYAANTSSNPELTIEINNEIRALEERKNILENQNLETNEKDISKFIKDLNEIDTKIDEKIMDFGKNDLRRQREDIEIKSNEFLYNLENEKKAYTEMLLSSVPEDILSLKSPDGKLIKDILKKELYELISKIGVEIYNLPTDLNKALRTDDADIFLERYNSIKKRKQAIEMGPRNYIRSVNNWDKNHETSSKILSTAKTYSWALNFLLDESKPLESKLGIDIPEGKAYQKTREEIKRQELILKEKRFLNRYQLELHDVLRMKERIEQKILAQYIADLLNDQSKDTENETHYTKDEVLCLLDEIDKEKYSSYKSLSTDSKTGKLNRNKYNRENQKLLDLILNSNTKEGEKLTDQIKLSIEGGSDGVGASKFQDSYIEAAKFIRNNPEIFNDPIIKQYTEEFEIISNWENYSIDEQKRFKRHFKEKMTTAQGGYNILISVIRVKKAVGDDEEKVKEIYKSGHKIQIYTYSSQFKDRSDRFHKYGRGGLRLSTKKTEAELNFLNYYEKILEENPEDQKEGSLWGKENYISRPRISKELLEKTKETFKKIKKSAKKAVKTILDPNNTNRIADLIENFGLNVDTNLTMEDIIKNKEALKKKIPEIIPKIKNFTPQVLEIFETINSGKLATSDIESIKGKIPKDTIKEMAFKKPSYVKARNIAEKLVGDRKLFKTVPKTSKRESVLYAKSLAPLYKESISTIKDINDNLDPRLIKNNQNIQEALFKNADSLSLTELKKAEYQENMQNMFLLMDLKKIPINKRTEYFSKAAGDKEVLDINDKLLNKIQLEENAGLYISNWLSTYKKYEIKIQSQENNPEKINKIQRLILICENSKDIKLKILKEKLIESIGIKVENKESTKEEMLTKTTEATEAHERAFILYSLYKGQYKLSNTQAEDISVKLSDTLIELGEYKKITEDEKLKSKLSEENKKILTIYQMLDNNAAPEDIELKVETLNPYNKNIKALKKLLSTKQGYDHIGKLIELRL